MTVNQLNRLFFPESHAYGYKRLRQLRQAGYLIARPYVKRSTGLKQSTCYYLSKSGYRAIGEDHYNPGLLIEPHKHDYQVSLSEIYLQIIQEGWIWRNSRVIKNIHNLNRGNKIAASIARVNPKSFTGEDEYALYLVSKNTQGNTIENMQNELRKNLKHINSAIILHQGNQRPLIYQKDDGTLVQWTSHLDMYQLHIMQYDEGVKLLKLMVDPDFILKDPFKRTWEGIGAKYVGPEPELFSQHLVYYGGKHCYLVELVTNNLTTIYHLKNYSRNEARTKDRPVVILVPPGEETYWRKEFGEEHYPHFRFFPVEGIG